MPSEDIICTNADGSLTPIGKAWWRLGIEQAKIAKDNADYSGCDAAIRDLIRVARDAESTALQSPPIPRA